MAGFGKYIQPSKEKENWYTFQLPSRGTMGAETLDIRLNKQSGKWEFQYWLWDELSGTKNPTQDEAYKTPNLGSNRASGDNERKLNL